MSKDKDIFENIKCILSQSSQVHCIFVNVISKIKLPNLPKDSRTRFNREALIKWMILTKLLQVETVHQSKKSQWSIFITMGKDVLYNVKNNPYINWRGILLDQANQSMKGISIEEDSRSQNSIPCFILDDTDIPKRGKCIEWIGRIFSHVTHKHDLGFKSLNLAYWSGKHLLHLDFSFHVEMGKKKNQGMKKSELKDRYKKERKDNSMGARRIEELVKKKTDCAIKMITRALKKGIESSYILADSWFFNSALAAFAIDKKVHLISRPKFNNWKYKYNGKLYTIGELIRKKNRNKEVKWNRHLRLKFIKVPVEFQGLQITLIYYKSKKRGSDWKSLVTTDNTLSAQKAFKIYQTRWSIENSYKELKQHLRYGKCMSRDFDGQISDATQCLMAYNILSQQKAINQHQSIGMLFDKISKQWLKPTMMQKFWKEFYDIIKKIAEEIGTEIDILIDLAINQSSFLLQLSKLNLIATTET